jgi:hypothetical protein
MCKTGLVLEWILPPELETTTNQRTALVAVPLHAGLARSLLIVRGT